jgi:hypothetical protein
MIAFLKRAKTPDHLGWPRPLPGFLRQGERLNQEPRDKEEKA